MSSLVDLSSCSHLVVGAGIIGSWTAWHLQQELGEAGRVALVDSFPLPHTRGSSHGGSRVIRFLGDDDLSKLDYSLDMWHRLEEETCQILHVTTGLINLGECEPATGECRDSYLLKHMGVLERAGKPYEWLGAEEVKRRFPSLKYPDTWGAVSDPSGAILLAHR
jgi:glycine/D-amino acid oxidase-like deaminating enzyme